MVKPSDALDEIVEAYSLERDTLKVARASIYREDASALAGTSFIALPVEDALNALDRATERLEQMTILTLWIAFERHVLDDVKAQFTPIASIQAPGLGFTLAQQDSGKNR